MKITIKFSGEMHMDINVMDLMENELKYLVEEYIKENMYELMECNVTLEE